MRIRRMTAVVVLGALLVWLPACGKKTDEAARAAGITPADALGFLTLSLDPSIEQKRNLYNIARRFPDAQAKDDFNKTKEDLLKQMLEDSGLDYETEVKPWLGSEVAVAVLPAPAGSKMPQVAVFIEQDDRQKAQAALDKANKQATDEGGDPVRYRFVDDFVVVAGTEESDEAAADAVLDAIEAQAKADSGDLASSAEFTEVVDKLRGDRLLLGWVDAQEALKTLNEFLKEAGPTPFDFSAALKEAGPTAFDLHVGDASVVFEGVAKAMQPAAGGDPKLTESAPADSFGAFTVFDVRKMVLDSLAAVKQANGEDVLATVKEETGIDLAVDVLPWMGGESVLVSAPAPGGRALPDFGLVVEPTDRAAAEAGIARIAAALEDRQGVTFARPVIAGTKAYVVPRTSDGTQPGFALFADRVVVATTPAYLEKLATAASPPLSDSAAYQSVLGRTESSATRFQFVLDIDAIREAVEKALGADDESAGYNADVKPNLVPLDAFGAVVRRDGAYERFEMKLTFD